MVINVSFALCRGVGHDAVSVCVCLCSCAGICNYDLYLIHVNMVDFFMFMHIYFTVLVDE